LIEFGARTEAVTRAGASAQTWARVRTFAEVARCLESHAPKAVAVAPAPAIDAPAPVAVPATVQTLKEPPEIWDLVHEVPRSFNPRSAFIARIKSMKRTFAVAACVAVLLMAGVGVGALVLRNSQARSLPAEVPPVQIAVEPSVTSPPQSQAVVESPPVEVVNGNHSRAVPNKARVWLRQPRTAPVVNEVPAERVQSSEATAVAAPQIESPKPAPPAVKTTSNTPLSPHLITPSKNAPPKGKVIQWP
jgi:hypothetical protein